MKEVVVKGLCPVTGDLRGHGLVSSVGGKGSGSAGGGSGGRIAVHAGYSNDFLGQLEAHGTPGEQLLKNMKIFAVLDEDNKMKDEHHNEKRTFF